MGPYRIAVAACAAVAALLAGCRSADAPSGPDVPPGTVRIASFDFAESRLLGEIYATALDQKGFEVVHVPVVGPREIVAPALEQGFLDFVPEYLGTSLAFVSLGKIKPSARPSPVHEALTRVYAKRGVAVLDYAPAQDHNGVAVTQETADRLGLEKVSDLQGVAGDMTFGGPEECPERPLCLKGLEDVYGLDFAGFLPLDAGGPATVAALESGEVDAALLFSTDPNIAVEGFALLSDDMDLQPAENVVPVVRAEIVQRLGPRFTRVVNSVTERLTTAELRDLNERVQLDGRPSSEVALAWLTEEGWASYAR
jgi:osmoprotectant transport system substrate-binding protein